MRDIENWLSKEEIGDIYTSSYWNDIDEEKKKKFLWIEDGDYKECLNYLKSSRNLYAYEESEAIINSFFGDSLKLVDLAAGIGWTSALLSKIPKISEVHAVEISRHRLDLLFGHSVKMLSGQEDKIFRYLGSFYDLHFADKSMDIIYLSQAFHHADRPFHLLMECDRVLKDNGKIILVGEHYISIKKIIRTFLSILLRRRKFVTNFHEMFIADQVLGDHYYRSSDYYFMFGTMGYSVRHQLLGNESAIYIAEKKT